MVKIIDHEKLADNPEIEQRVDAAEKAVKFNENEEDIYQVKSLSKKAISEGIESVINPQNTSFQPEENKIFTSQDLRID